MSKLDALTLRLRKVEALLEIMAGRPVVRRKDLAIRYGKSLNTIDTYKADGTLPRPRYLRGCPFPFWTAEEIEANEHNRPVLIRALRRANPNAYQDAPETKIRPRSQARRR